MDLIQKSIQNCDSAFLYQLLDRMKSDCQYYFGSGRIYGSHLWGREEKRHIAYMKEIWESFSPSEKPEWLTYEDILAYERRLDSRFNCSRMYSMKLPRNLAYVHGALATIPMRETRIQFCSIR